MQRPSVFWGLAANCAAAIMSMCLCVGSALAQGKSGNYAFLVGSGFLCDPNNSSACAATAKGDPGDSYELSGAGTFDAVTKSIQAAGTFAHKSTSGHVLETGVWVASELVSFNSYGTSPGALPQEALAFRSTLFGAKRSPLQTGVVPTGGLAAIRVRLFSISGLSRIAVLELNCALGSVPSERSVEGIRVIFDRNEGKFSEEAGGRVMFLATRPEVNSLTRVPQEAAPESAEAARN